MAQPLKWLQDAGETRWSGLSDAMRAQLPAPDGFVVFPDTHEMDIRDAYEEMKVREKTHFVAVRGAAHAVLNVISGDALIHMLRRFFAETPQEPVLIQRMVHASWCGKAYRQGEALVVKANEGMMLFDPDTYVVKNGAGATQKRIQPEQRKMIRHVDGSSRTFELKTGREGMTDAQLKSVAGLVERAGTDIVWALDDQDRPWLLSVITTVS